MNVVLRRNATSVTNSMDISWSMHSKPYIVSSFNITLTSEHGVITSYPYSPDVFDAYIATTLTGLRSGESYTATVKSQSGMVFSPDSTTSNSTRLSE